MWVSSGCLSHKELGLHKGSARELQSVTGLSLTSITQLLSGRKREVRGWTCSSAPELEIKPEYQDLQYKHGRYQLMQPPGGRIAYRSEGTLIELFAERVKMYRDGLYPSGVILTPIEESFNGVWMVEQSAYVYRVKNLKTRASVNARVTINGGEVPTQTVAYSVASQKFKTNAKKYNGIMAIYNALRGALLVAIAMQESLEIRPMMGRWKFSLVHWQWAYLVYAGTDSSEAMLSDISVTHEVCYELLRKEYLRLMGSN
ncbi:hypothetical protein [Vibrio barjaei]|uniref:hypothetical protein n=1 Tax=Vibrio barjaei TaxID=1676683 RepID=UPI0022832ECE|nr:hypothetical protein [Vibrio barjaei]MCY9870498.1 hypothetical protein [Vibrio barjaei]